MPKKQTIKLSQKALILVAFPLVFEIFFVSILLLMVQNSERETLRAEHSRMTIVYADTLIRRLYELGMATLAQNTVGGQLFVREFDRAALRVKEDLRLLRENVSKDRQQLQTLNEITPVVNSVMTTLQRGRESIEPDEQDFPLRYQGYDYRLELEPLLNELVPKIEAITAHEKQLRKAHPLSEQTARGQVRLAIALGIAMNILMAFGLAFYFNRSTTTRFAVLLDNAIRLGENKSLNMQLDTGDEIGNLDKTFHEMAERLERAAAKESAIIRNAVDVICSVNEDGTFLVVSPGVEEAWGYLPEKLAGTSIYQLVSAEEQQKLKAGLKKLRSTSLKENLSTQILKPDGAKLDALWSLHWVEAEQCFFCVVHDITSQKQIERMKEEFLQMVSHDLRTPLSTIDFFLQFLMEGGYGKISERGERAANGASRDSKRLIKLVNDLLDIEKLSTGNMPLNMKTCSADEILDSAFESLRGVAEKSEIGLEICPQTKIQLNADQDRLIQVVVNLGANAIKFSPKSGTVRLEACRTKDWVEFSVIDEGRGVPENMRELIFERFKQVQAEDASEKGGKGLGLAICKAIVVAHSGEIGLESEEGKGSRFWFRIPSDGEEGTAQSSIL